MSTILSFNNRVSGFNFKIFPPELVNLVFMLCVVFVLLMQEQTNIRQHTGATFNTS